MDDINSTMVVVDSCPAPEAEFWTFSLERILALVSALALVATAIVLYPRRRRYLLNLQQAGGNQGAAASGTLARAGSDHDDNTSIPAPAPAPASPTAAGGGISQEGFMTCTDGPSSVMKELEDGEHSVVFEDGSSYNGEWLQGKMHGIGVFQWPSGDRYEGEWKEGEQEGQGTFAAADGSIYFGGWSGGKMDGSGVYTPAIAAPAPGRKVAPRTTTTVVYLREYSQGRLVKEVALSMEEDPVKKQARKDERKKAMAARPLAPGEVIYKGHHSYDLMRQLQLGIMYSIAQAGHVRGDARSSSSTSPLRPSDFRAEAVQYFPSGSTGEAAAFKYKDYQPRVFQVLRNLFGVDSADYLISLTGGPALRELPSPGASGCIFFLSSNDRFLIKSLRKEEMELVLGLMQRYVEHVQANPFTLLVHFFGVHRISPWLGRNARFVIMGNVLPTDRRMHRKYDLKGSTYKRTVGKERRQNDPNVALKDLDIDMKLELSPERYKRLIAQLESDAAFLEEVRVIDYSLLLGVHFVRWGESEWSPPFEDWPERQGQEGQGQGQGQGRGLVREGSMAAGRSLVETLQDLSKAGIEPALSESAAVMVASANKVRLAARLSAAAASTAGNARLVHLTRRTKMPNVGPMRSTTNSTTHKLESKTLPENGGNDARSRGLGQQHQQQHERTASSEMSPSAVRDRKRRTSEAETDVGWGIPATAVRTSSTGVVSREPVLLYFGIIDFLQQYNTRKRLEHAWKASMHGAAVSVADPKFYAHRFLTFLKGVFVEEGTSGSLK